MNIDLPDAFLLLFVGLKLSHHIDWSWWFVMSPWMIPFMLDGFRGLFKRITGEPE